MQTISLNKIQTSGLTLLRVLGLLIVLQAVRAALRFGFWQVLGLPDYLDGAAPILAAIDLVILILLAGLLWWIGRPTVESLGLLLSGRTRGQLIFTGLAGALFAVLLIISFVSFPDQIANNLRAALLFPIMEELLFRGWIWHELKEKAHLPEGWVYGLVTLAFGLWHLGYVDAVLQTPGSASRLAQIMMFKVVIGIIVGILAGLARWRAGNTYAGMIMHGLWNLFGR